MRLDEYGSWFIYCPETGEIFGQYSGVYSCALIDLANESYVQITDGSSDISSSYVDLSTLSIVPRPEMDLVITGTKITGIPEQSVVILGEQSFVVDDGEADIEGYTGIVKITCWPYLDVEVEV